MEEYGKLYTVRDIATMTRLTSRTIRNYLKDGRLKGRKIGGEWRFTVKDIRRLFENSTVTGDVAGAAKQQIYRFIDGVTGDTSYKTRVCTIVDCHCENRKEGHRLYEKLVTVINAINDDSQKASFNYEYNDQEGKARFILFGSPEFIIQTLQLL